MFLRTSASCPAFRSSSLRPSSFTDPLLGVSMHPIMFISVVLPEPDEPTMASHSPCGTVRLRSSTACRSP